MIRIFEVTKKFRRKTVLNRVSLDIENGVYGMLGPNGAGKTTLIRCLLGLYPINGGKITMDIPYYRVGYLPQNFGLFRELKVYDILDYFCGLRKIPVQRRKTEIDLALDSVNLMEYKKTTISKLSGGMQRRLGIALAVLGKPPVIIFDEPTVGLDPEERKRFKNLLFELKNESTILFSSHIVSDLEEVCEKVIIMDKGNVIMTGALKEICEKYSGDGKLENAYLNIMGERKA